MRHSKHTNQMPHRRGTPGESVFIKGSHKTLTRRIPTTPKPTAQVPTRFVACRLFCERCHTCVTSTRYERAFNPTCTLSKRQCRWQLTCKRLWGIPGSLQGSPWQHGQQTIKVSEKLLKLGDHPESLPSSLFRDPFFSDWTKCTSLHIFTQEYGKHFPAEHKQSRPCSTAR